MVEKTISEGGLKVHVGLVEQAVAKFLPRRCDVGGHQPFAGQDARLVVVVEQFDSQVSVQFGQDVLVEVQLEVRSDGGVDAAAARGVDTVELAGGHYAFVGDEGVTVGKKLLDVTREANEAVKGQNEFKEFDKSLDEIKKVASNLGLGLNDLKVLLELKENVYSQSSITLHDGDVPFHLHGKGAKRLLSIAIQLSAVQDGGIILIDEIEQGLEPDRLVCECG